MSVKGIQKCVLSARGMGVIASNGRFAVGWLQVGTLPMGLPPYPANMSIFAVR